MISHHEHDHKDCDNDYSEIKKMLAPLVKQVYEVRKEEDEDGI